MHENISEDDIVIFLVNVYGFEWRRTVGDSSQLSLVAYELGSLKHASLSLSITMLD